MGKAVRSADFWSGLALALLGGWIVMQARQWEYLGDDGPGAGFFPLWYGIAMLVLAVMLAGSAMMRAAREADAVDWPGILRALLVWFVLALAVASFWLVGFVIGFALLYFFLAVAVYRRPWGTSIVEMLCLTLGFHLVFSLGLGVPLPTGWFGF